MRAEDTQRLNTDNALTGDVRVGVLASTTGDFRLLELTVRELVEDYKEADEDGVTGYGGKLDIRPPFQRAFVYNNKERNAVIDSILKGFPLNVRKRRWETICR